MKQKVTGKRTPGPWQLQPIGNGHRVTGGPQHRIVAHVPARREPDAKLIVAAPAMLEVLQDVLRKDSIAGLRSRMRAIVDGLAEQERMI